MKNLMNYVVTYNKDGKTEISSWNFVWNYFLISKLSKLLINQIFDKIDIDINKKVP